MAAGLRVDISIDPVDLNQGCIKHKLVSGNRPSRMFFKSAFKSFANVINLNGIENR